VKRRTFLGALAAVVMAPLAVFRKPSVYVLFSRYQRISSGPVEVHYWRRRADGSFFELAPRRNLTSSEIAGPCADSPQR